MPDYLQGGAPPRAWADCLRILFPMRITLFADEMYASSPQGVYLPKIRDAPEGKHKTGDPGSP